MAPSFGPKPADLGQKQQAGPVSSSLGRCEMRWQAIEGARPSLNPTEPVKKAEGEVVANALSKGGELQAAALAGTEEPQQPWKH